MELLFESAVRERAKYGRTRNTALERLHESTTSKSASLKEFDIFLSHSFKDNELIAGVMLTLEDLGYSVYVDWVHDQALDRTRVSASTARVLKARIEASKCLLFATTENSAASVWMPWELGYKDGKDGRVATLPLLGNDGKFSRQEYLEIYPYTSVVNDVRGKKHIQINASDTEHVFFDEWLKGHNPYKR